MTNKSIYELGLGEKTTLHIWEVNRVPGGWFFRSFDPNTQCHSIVTFVPYSDEFNPNIEPMSPPHERA